MNEDQSNYLLVGGVAYLLGAVMVGFASELLGGTGCGPLAVGSLMLLAAMFCIYKGTKKEQP